MVKALFVGLFLFSSTSFAGYQSVYTNIDYKSCVTVDSSELHSEPEIDFYTGECPALGGYRVTISGGDIRYSLKLNYNGVEIPTVRPGGFHDLPSSKIEWRYERVGSWGNYGVNYKALIYRLNATVDYDDSTGNPISEDMLVVVRLKREKSCVVGIVKQQADMNKKARKIADNMNASCIAL